jgi:hypothetical protein
MGFSEKREYQASQPHHFQPFQVVCLEHKTSHLYAEVVQTVEKRQVCWVRPLVLRMDPQSDSSDSDDSLDSNPFLDQSCYYDLRQDSDLLFPLILFRTALDTEMVPLLNFLYSSSRNARTDLSDHTDKINRIEREKFRQFIQQVWQAYPELF